MRKMRAGFSPARIFLRLSGVAAALSVAAAPLPAFAAPASAQVVATAVTAQTGGQAITDVYRARGGRPLWLSQENGAAVPLLLELLDSAQLDGLSPRRYDARRLAKALRDARRGDIRGINRAESMLSEAFVAYARELRRAPNIGVIYVDRELIPAPPSPRSLLEGAASAPSLAEYVAKMGWLNPAYAQLRSALRSGAYSGETQRQLLALNLERARTLPAGPERYVVVNTAAQRLHMYEGGREVDSMRVVVGKPKHATPMMSAFIRFTSLNPYWNVPPDLAAERIAPFVVKEGTGYLRKKGYQLLSDWGDNPKLVDPKTVDWKAVETGQVEVRVRQLPGPSNAMGKMKFMFPNSEGIYLHDTPDDELFAEASRLFSGGCVRLEDAPRLARWLHGSVPKASGTKAEQSVPLPVPVPVYLTYLTAFPSGTSVAWFDDIYGRDRARLAQLGGAAALASR